jgi:DUF971 family protein
MTTPKSIKKEKDHGIVITWNDGHESRYSFELLRDCCPCASCNGETVLMHSYTPPPPDRTIPGRYDLKGIQQVGSYAIQIEWGDGHATGIYSWEHLLENCPCPVHRGAVRA